MAYRKSGRLKDYDYTNSNYYFVTICCNYMQQIFGSISNSNVILNDFGLVAKECWEKIPQHYNFTDLDEYIIMPNHIHGIIILNKLPGITDKDRIFGESIKGSLSNVVGSYKSAVTKLVNRNSETKIIVWERNFYDRIIRNERELYNIRKYIKYNALKWNEADDIENLDL